MENEAKQIKSISGYGRFIAGQIVSLLGSEIVGFVIGIYLARTYQSPIFMAIVMIIQFLPRVIISPIAGVWADKRNRKKIIITSDLLQAVVTTTLVLLFNLNALFTWSFWAVGELYILFGFLLVRSVLQAIQGPSVSSTLPTIVPADKLSRINGVFQFANGVMGLIAPILAAVLIAVFNTSIYNLLWIDAITFLVALAFVISVNIPKHPKVEEQTIHQTQMSRFSKFRKDFMEGINVTREVVGLASLLATFVLTNIMVSPMNTLSEILILVTHEASNLEYVVTTVSFAVGLIAGSIVSSLVKSWKNMTNTMFLGIIFVFVGLFLFGVAPPPSVVPGEILGVRISFLIIAGSGFITTFFIPIMSTIAVTMIQLSVPIEKMGRFSGFMNAIISFFTPIGYLISGFLGEYFNIHWVIGSASVIAIITIICMWSFSKVNRLEPIIKEKLALVKQQAMAQAQTQDEPQQETNIENQTETE
ncbi:MAG: MFS transporter [Promethearchaeota archaeon]